MFQDMKQGQIVKLAAFKIAILNRTAVHRESVFCRGQSDRALRNLSPIDLGVMRSGMYEELANASSNIEESTRLARSQKAIDTGLPQAITSLGFNQPGIILGGPRIEID